MIRINLIAEKKAEKVKKPFFTLEAGNEAAGNMLMAAVIVGAILLCGYKYISLRSNLSDLSSRIADANQEKERLQEILRKGEEFKQHRELLRKKVDLISALKKNQSVPVHLLDQVSRKLPEFLWLDSMTERANRISISGKATNYNAVSNFYNNLKESPFFSGVVLGTTQEVNEGVSFQMSCTFEPEKLQEPETDPATTQAATPAVPASAAQGL